MVSILENLKLNKKTLIVVDELTENLILSTRNLKNIILIAANEINVLDVVSADNMLITQDAVKMVEEALI